MKWLLPNEAGKIKDKNAQSFALKVFSEYYGAILAAQVSKDWKNADEILKTIIDYQKNNALQIIPSETKVSSRIFCSFGKFQTSIFPADGRKLRLASSAQSRTSMACPEI